MWVPGLSPPSTVIVGTAIRGGQLIPLSSDFSAASSSSSSSSPVATAQVPGWVKVGPEDPVVRSYKVGFDAWTTGGLATAGVPIPEC